MKNLLLGFNHKAQRWLTHTIFCTAGWLTAVLLLVLTVAHYMVATRAVAYVTVSYKALVYMIPQMLLFAIPLAITCSIGLTYQRMAQSGILFLCGILSALRSAWYTTILFFSVVTGCCSYFIGGYAAPFFYRKAKQEIFESVVTTLSHAAPGRMHNVTHNLSLGFLSTYQRKQSRLFVYLTVVTTLDKRPVIIVARRGCFKKGKLVCLDGSFHFCDEKQKARHRFKEMHVSYKPLFGIQSIASSSATPRYLTNRELMNRSQQEDDIELWRRYIHLIWSLCLPLLMLFTLPLRLDRRSNAGMVRIIASSGILFLTLYFVSHMGASYAAKNMLFAAAIMLFPVGVCVLWYYVRTRSRLSLL